MQDLSWLAALVAGAASFFSPCHLPLLPVYVTFLAGGERRGSYFLVNALAFCIGFSTVFVALGASVGYVGMLLSRYHELLRILGGVFMVIFGLHLSGWLKFSLLCRERHWQAAPRSGPAGAFMLGLVFAFAWTPCAGPVLAAILTLAGLAESAETGMRLLTVYAIGMSIPFLGAAWLVYNGSAALVRRFYPLAEVLGKAGGVIIILMGLLLLLDKFPTGF